MASSDPVVFSEPKLKKNVFREGLFSLLAELRRIWISNNNFNWHCVAALTDEIPRMADAPLNYTQQMANKIRLRCSNISH